ncbi:hypothetical protein NQ176_g7462 [Zarea fungicola]|uniref:Uncharacterized protein n=1 Tax=Zarea fungicola TaxID=93591 RepID=A0ACC1MYJ1_9HYPO|nr:hypothetical protein NQ176_g7462 [Lecanicillium fungicola]
MTEQPIRRPLTGSCHCNNIQYIIHLTLPHPHDPSLPLPLPMGYQQFYRCNCTTCHKMGHFHVRPVSPTHDFLLFSAPSSSRSDDEEEKSGEQEQRQRQRQQQQQDPLSGLGDYTCGAGNLHFYFCKACGVRCFIFAGDLEAVEADVDQLDLAATPTWLQSRTRNSGSGSSSSKVKAWRPRLGGGHPDMGHYLSVNGHTIDAEQGFDMRELTEKNQVRYCDCYSPEEDEVPMRYGRPQQHGSY